MWYLIKDNEIEKVIHKKPSGDFELNGKLIPTQLWSNPSELAKYNIHKITEVYQMLFEGERHLKTYTVDLNTFTLTYDKEVIPQEELDAEAAKQLASYIRQVKEEAGRRILYLMPEWKQRNYTARMTELLKNKEVNGSWTPEEEAEITFLEGEWAKAKQVRLDSDALETAYPLPEDVNVDHDVNWSAATHNPEDPRPAPDSEIE